VKIEYPGMLEQAEFVPWKLPMFKKMFANFTFEVSENGIKGKVNEWDTNQYTFCARQGTS